MTESIFEEDLNIMGLLAGLGGGEKDTAHIDARQFAKAGEVHSKS
jgi:hypothetical protein